MSQWTVLVGVGVAWAPWSESYRPFPLFAGNLSSFGSKFVRGSVLEPEFRVALGREEKLAGGGSCL